MFIPTNTNADPTGPASAVGIKHATARQMAGRVTLPKFLQMRRASVLTAVDSVQKKTIKLDAVRYQMIYCSTFGLV